MKLSSARGSPFILSFPLLVEHLSRSTEIGASLLGHLDTIHVQSGVANRKGVSDEEARAAGGVGRRGAVFRGRLLSSEPDRAVPGPSGR